MSRRDSKAIKSALGNNPPSDEQWAAISHPPEPVAVVAGAGTGKTAVMAARIVWMVEDQGLQPSQILGLTFTNRAAGELEERVNTALDLLDSGSSELPLIATYNAFADRLVRAHGVRIGIDPEAGLLSAGQRWQVLTDALDNVAPFEYADWVSVAHFARTAIGLADACSNHDVTPDMVIEEDSRVLREMGDFDNKVRLAADRRIELMQLVKAYLEAKQAKRWIDFGDQMTKALEILESSESLTEELSSRYPMILLDEYQDTNVVQRKLMQLLAPTGHNVTAVGDARQNVYEWRGSTIFNLIDFPKKHFLRAGETTHDYLPLSLNFRSGSQILKVANAIIGKVHESRQPGEDLKAHEPNGEGFVGTAMFTDEFAEAEFIAGEIETRHGEKLGPVSADWKEFAILVRRRSMIFRIYDALRKRQIPVEVVGLGGLLEIPEVVDTVAWLRVLADPGPEANRWLARILIGPGYRIHYRDLAVMARWATRNTKDLSKEKRGDRDESEFIDETQFEPDLVAYSLLDALDRLDEIEGLGQDAAERLQRAREQISSLRSLQAHSLLELVQAVVEETGIAEELRASPRQDAAASMRNLTKFVGLVGDFMPVFGEPSLPAFLKFLDSAEEAEETLEIATPSGEDSVKLMTVHQAKGLEFAVVFVPGVAARENKDGEKVDSIFPSQIVTDPARSYGALPFGVREDAEHLPNPWVVGKDGGKIPKKAAAYRRELLERALEEERRLFYVALTRAKQRLYVTAAYYYERHTSARGPSLFFEEVAGIQGVQSLAEQEPPESSPNLERLAAEAIWPVDPEHRLSYEAPFAEGYPVLVEQLMSGEVSAADVLARVNPEASEHLQEHRKVIEGLSAPATEPDDLMAPKSFSATSVANLAGGRVAVGELRRPLPERPSAARRIGTELHQWIEERSRGLMGLADEEELDEPSAPTEPSRLASMKRTFEDEWSERTYAKIPGTGEPMAELGFVLKVGDALIRGRIDAVYEAGDGGLEIVDFKSGKKVESEFPDQLDVYAAALGRLGVSFEGPLTLTYAYLSTGERESRNITAEEAEAVLERLEAVISQS